MKKLMILGGSRYIVPVIQTAKKLGIYTITCDFLPNNIAHKYSDEYVNASVIKKEEILEIARKRKIDGIMSFACDPGVVTAAYTAEKMGLPFQCSYEAACILQDKGLFREFLAKNHFNVPHAKRYTDKNEPFKELDYFTWPVIVKPVDSAGSKGVTRVDLPEQLSDAIDKALSVALNGAFIIEDFITFEGYHSSADPFSVNGKLKFITYSDQLFDTEADNPYTPSLIIWPSSMKEDYQSILTNDTQKLLDLLHMETGIYNIETCVGKGGKPYIMEVSPRGGGCEIAQLQKMAYGVDLIENEVRKAVGMPLLNIEQSVCNGYWCEMVIHTHADQGGKLKNIIIDPEIEKKYIQHKDISANKGEIVKPFSGANMSLGDMFLKFNSREKLDEVMSKSSEWLKIELE